MSSKLKPHPPKLCALLSTYKFEYWQRTIRLGQNTDVPIYFTAFSGNTTINIVVPNFIRTCAEERLPISHRKKKLKKAKYQTR